MEALTASQDSENRITIGGKRKSSSRRSSILKATKSPLKAGVLEDLDPNSLDDNGRSRSKKSRRSSGRRVSFAEKNDIKEFFVEDWKSAWNKDTDDSNLQVPSSASQGEYRKPAESIQGLESLLKGDIQADDNQMCRVEIQAMPEVQYNQLSMTNEENAVNYDRGILLQTVTDVRAQHTIPLDVTICHGAGIIGANPSDQAKEMEYTKCHSSVLPSAATNMDQTRLFSEDSAIELDVTCTQQEIFFRDYPNAQLSSPDSLEQSGKMDSKSFLMSLVSKPSSTQTNEVTGPKEFSSVGNAYHKRQPLGELTDMQSSIKSKQGGVDQNGTRQQVSNVDDNVALTACHSYKGLEKSVPKTNRRSIYEPADIDVTSCYGPGLMKLPDKQECQGPDGVSVLIRSQTSGETTNLNTRRSTFETDMQAQSHPEYTAQLDVTSCYGNGILPGKRSVVPGVDQTVVFTTNSVNTHSLELTVCQGQEGNDSDENLELTACHSYEVLDNSIPKTSQKSICEPADLDVTSCYGPGLIKSPEKQITRSYEEHTGQVDTTRCYGKGILPSKRLSVAGADQTMVFAANTDGTESLDFTVCQPQQGHAAVLPLPGSLSQNNHDHSFSHGSGKMDSSAFLKSLCATPHSSATNNNAHDLPGSEDVSAFRNPTSGAITSANANRNSFEKDFQALQLEEQTGQVDTTRCYGKGILPNKRLSVAGADQTMVFAANTDNTESLDYTVCQPQQGLPFAASPSQNYQSDHQSSFHGSGKMDSSLFLKSLNATPHSSATRNDEYDDEMDLTTSVPTGALTGEEMLDQNRPVKSMLSMESNLSCTKTNEVTKVLPSSSSFQNAYLIKNPFSKTTDVQEPTSHFDENVELTVCHSKPVPDNSMQQKAKRRSVYEPTDIDVTSCYGPGLLQSPGKEEASDDVCKSALNLSRSLRAATIANRFSGNVTLNTTQDLHGWNTTQQQQSDFNENLELTTSQGRQFISNNSQKTNRRSIYEPADIDVTSCHGVGLVKSSGENLELASSYSQQVLDKSLQKASRRSLYEPADVDVTSCHGPGLVKSSGENLELTVSQNQPVLDKSSQRANRRSLYEPADVDVTSCHGPGLVIPSGENLEFTGPHSQPDLNNSTQRTDQRSFYEPAEIDVTSCHGVGLVNSSGDNLELTGPDIQPVLDNSAQRTNRRSFYEPAEIDVTSCHGAGLVKSSGDNLELTVPHVHPVLDNSTQRTNRHSLYEPAEIDVTSCHGIENSEPTVSHSQYADDNTQQTPRQNPCELSDVDATSFQGEQDVISNHFSETALNLTEVPETSFHQVNGNATLDQAEELHDSEEILQTSRVAANSNANFQSTVHSADIDVTSSHAPEQDKSIDDQITSDANDRKLSIICEESVNELSKREMSEDANVTEVEEMQNTTQSPITLKQFLDITEIAFITEVNMRRSIAPSNLVESPKTTKDMIISSLVSKPKAACYEEAIPAIEAEITNMKEKVEQQEMELNAFNPRVFMEAQSASKEELLEMQSKVRRLRSVCEKTTKREWKEGKGQLNKRILSKITENYQALASDVHVVEESLSMVDDCLNLLDKMDNDLDEGIRSMRQSLEENEKKLQEQTTMVEQLESMAEALKKSEQELADLESKRSTMQSEKQELSSRKEMLHVTLLENEEAIRLLKNKDPRSEDAATKALSQKLDILESLQEWSLEGWDKERARFTFLKGSLEMVVLFASESSDSEDSSSDQEVKSIQLNFTPAEEFTGKMGKVHTLVKQAVNQDVLTQMCHSKKDLAKVLEHMSEIIFRSNKIGAELFRIGLSHLMSFKENRFVVEFSSLKAFVKFVLYIQLDLQSYPDGVTFTVSSMIGHLSQTEIEEALNIVDAGPRYLSRLVDAADQLLNKAKATSNMPS